MRCNPYPARLAVGLHGRRCGGLVVAVEQVFLEGPAVFLEIHWMRQVVCVCGFTMPCPTATTKVCPAIQVGDRSPVFRENHPRTARRRGSAVVSLPPVTAAAGPFSEDVPNLYPGALLTPPPRSTPKDPPPPRFLQPTPAFRLGLPFPKALPTAFRFSYRLFNHHN